jgi:hypothetical protein
MRKSLLTIAAVLAVLSAGSLVSDRAEAGGSISAPTKYANGSQTPRVSQVRTGRLFRTPRWISEYSSSSARPRR